MASSAYDALIVGAGPAGISAALRLQQFGYRVMLIERSAVWPRRQIGEALTHGVQNIVALLDANDALAATLHLAGRPSRLLWRGRTAEMVADSGSAMVDRAHFDAALLALAQQRGVEIERPARIQAISGVAGDWRLTLHCGGTDTNTRQVTVRCILDASGRADHGHYQRLDCAPRLAALWTEIPQTGLPAEMLDATQTEAIEHGWLWGASLPGGRYRAMLVFDPLTARASMPGAPRQRLHAACAGSRLFAGLVGSLEVDGAFTMCAATPYVAPDSWQPGSIKIGDAAFALDPVSSSGVEKAMRFSLQAAIALHTLLSDQTPAGAAMGQSFFEQRLVETCARHAHWTANSYRQAWCAEQPFWQQRALTRFEATTSSLWPDLLHRLRLACAQLQDFQAPALKPLAALDPLRALRLSAQAGVVELPCVIADRVQMHPALAHPNLERPLAFLENESLFPHLHCLMQPQPLARVLSQLGTSMPAHTAQKITAWLWQHGLLESVS